MISKSRLVVNRALDRYESNEPFKASRLVILGAGGHLGIWAVLYWISLEKQFVNIQNLTAVTAYPRELLRALRAASETNTQIEILQSENPALRTRLAEADLILDFRLPETSNNVHDQEGQKAVFLANISELMAICKPGAKIVIPSSGAVYGTRRTKGVALKESDSRSVEELSIYGKAKQDSEILCMKGPTDLTILNPRIFTCLGPYIRESSSLVTNVFFREARDNGIVGVLAGPRIFRDFTSVLDIQIQLSLWLSREDKAHNALNVGGAGPTSIRVFANSVAKEFGAKTEYLNFDECEDFYVPDVSALKAVIGDFSLPSLASEVRSTAVYFKNQI